MSKEGFAMRRLTLIATLAGWIGVVEAQGAVINQTLSAVAATYDTSTDVAFNYSPPPISLRALAKDRLTDGFASASQTVLNYDESPTGFSLHVLGNSSARLPVPPSPGVTSVVYIDSNLLRYDFTLSEAAFYSITASTLFQSSVPVYPSSALYVRLGHAGAPTYLFRIGWNEGDADTGLLSAGSYRVEANAIVGANGQPVEPQSIAAQYEIDLSVSPVPEPSTLIGLLSMGIVGLGVAWCKRRRALLAHRLALFYHVLPDTPGWLWIDE
jgi:hypothetical protein